MKLKLCPNEAEYVIQNLMPEEQEERRMLKKNFLQELKSTPNPSYV